MYILLYIQPLQILTVERPECKVWMGGFVRRWSLCPPAGQGKGEEINERNLPNENGFQTPQKFAFPPRTLGGGLVSVITAFEAQVHSVTAGDDMCVVPIPRRKSTMYSMKGHRSAVDLNHDLAIHGYHHQRTPWRHRITWMPGATSWHVLSPCTSPCMCAHLWCAALHSIYSQLPPSLRSRLSVHSVL